MIKEDKDSFLQVLEEIHEQVEKIHLSGVKKSGDGWLSGEVVELFNQRQRGLEFYFFIYLWYSGILNDDIPSDEMDVTILLNISDDKQKKKILDIWESINQDLHHTFPDWMQIIGNYKLNQYRSIKNDNVLVKWINGKFLYFLHDGGLPTTRLLLSIVEQTESSIGVDRCKKRMLILGDEEKMYLDLFTGKFEFNHCTLYPVKDYYYNCSILNSLLLGDDKIQVLKRQNDNKLVFPFEDARFDTVYSFIDKSDEKDTQYLWETMKLLDLDGVGFLFHQPNNIRIDNKWHDNFDYPLIASSVDGTLYVCRNSNLQNLIRSIFLWSSDTEIEFGADTIIKHFVKLINSHSIADDYQELTKEDYLYAPSNVPLIKIFRQPDQMDFIFRPISEIISYSKYNHDVPAFDVSERQIIEKNTLSENPFNLTLSPIFYLDSNVVDDSFSEKVKQELFCIEEESECSDILNSHFIDDHYKYVAEELTIKDTDEVVSSYDRNLLECRIMRKHGLLWDGNKRFCKVNATYNNPVCYRQCFFFIEEYYFGCNYNIREVNISPEFDEDFIIYQICNQKRDHFWGTSHILVARVSIEKCGSD